MKSTNMFLSLVALMLFFFATACTTEAQNDKKTTTTKTEVAKIEIIQFHSEHRCMTCNKIEELTRETLKSYTSIPFSLVNVDDKKNEKKAEQFEASGTSLFLYIRKTGKKKDLTDVAFMNARDVAFMNARDKDKFIEMLKKEIELFLKS